MVPENALGPSGVKELPWPQAAMVDEPDDPARAVVWPAFCTMTGTLFMEMFSKMIEFDAAGEESDDFPARMPMGQSLKLLSSIVREPTVRADVAPLLIFMPIVLLLKVIPWYVQPQSQSWLMPTTLLLKVKLRMVYCWLPTLRPYWPPLKIKSPMNPADPLSMNMPWCWVPAASDIYVKTFVSVPVLLANLSEMSFEENLTWKMTFCTAVAWPVGQ